MRTETKAGAYHIITSENWSQEPLSMRFGGELFEEHEVGSFEIQYYL